MSNNVTLIGNLVDDPELRSHLRVLRWPRSAWRSTVGGGARMANGRRTPASSPEPSGVSRPSRSPSRCRKGMRVIVTGRLEQRSWETQEGDKRSVVEIQIDEVGPSFVGPPQPSTRTQRSGGGDWAGNQQQQQPQNAPAPQARTDYGPDEAPF